MTGQLEAGRAAVKRGDLDEARLLLGPLVAESPAGPASIVLARLELDAERPEVAVPILDGFLAVRSDHGLASLMRARAHLATGDLAGARDDATRAGELLEDRSSAERVLAKVEAAEDARRVAALVERAAPLIGVIDAGHVEARSTGPSQEMRDAARELAGLPLEGDWTTDPNLSKIAFFVHAADPEEALRSYDAHLVEVSAEFGYITWPRRIQEHVRGRRVIDVGCGFGGFGVGFLVAGASSYVGLDPAMNMDSSAARNKRLRQRADMGITPRQIADDLPAIHLVRGKSEDLAFDEQFDTISLHNVTEHLAEPDLVFAGLVPLCHADTAVVFHHHNYYCWNGHHDPPVQPAQLDLSSPAHTAVYDWRHIDLLPDLPPGHRYLTGLNRIRLDELRAITERYFDIERWDEIPSSAATLDRFTPEILDRVRRTIPDLTERDLVVHAVLAVARPKRPREA
ncbi:methyltransferase [Nocardioides pelophilus]|uniref:methyltransferase n=1 Tax=Nocardioides pelophilus TaxID=2172019 RepID=UPI0015FF4560|nr:methyltransferase [Nocardioides pelophilus]